MITEPASLPDEGEGDRPSSWHAVGPLPEVHDASTADLWRAVAWARRGHRYGTKHGNSREKRASWFAYIIYPVFGVPQFAVKITVKKLRPNRTRYLVGGEAMIAINDTRQGWRIVDHCSAVPGSGSGKALREAALTNLAHELRSSTKPVYGESRVESLQKRYLDDFNQLAEAYGGRITESKTASGGLRITWHPATVAREPRR